MSETHDAQTPRSPFQAIDRYSAKIIASKISPVSNQAVAPEARQILEQSIMLLSFSLQQGHSCLSLQRCLTQAPYNQLQDWGYLPLPPTEQWLAVLQQFTISAEDNAAIVLTQGRLYFRRYFLFERELANFIHQHEQHNDKLTSEQIKRARSLLAELFDSTAETINWQQVAAANSLLNRFSIIVGGPGTGKTYTVTRILALLVMLSSSSLKIKLTAPTGKAAQRLSESIRQAKAELNLDMITRESIPDEASTLHRLLGVIPNSIQFRHNEDNPIDADVLLVDEVSMVDLPLMTRLSRALKPSTRVILLGDADQLPSVAAGSVLADLSIDKLNQFDTQHCQQLKRLGIDLKPSDDNQVHSNRMTALIDSRRFSQQSGIGALAKAVIAGQVKQSLDCFDNFADLEWFEEQQFDTQLIHWLRQYIKPISQQANVTDALALFKRFRLLAATRDGEHGINQLNQRISQQVNVNQQLFYQGQPIMISQNHYGLKLYNGDIGMVWPDEQQQLMVWFETEQGLRAITPGRLPAHEAVYAMTIHKTQGSEFDKVALLLPSEQSYLLNRELIYTGLTRAKNHIQVLGQRSVWQQAVNQGVERWAGLAEQIDLLKGK